MINGMRTGFVLDGKGNRLLPITHINLIIGDDGKSIRDTLDSVDNKLTSVQTYDELLSIDTSKLFMGSIGYVIDDKQYYSYSLNGWELMTTGSNGSNDDNDSGIDDTYSHIWIGPTPPENRNMIWIDTNSDGIIEGTSDLNILYSLLNQVSEMEAELVSLRKRVKYLEDNGVAIDPEPDEPTPDDPIEDSDDIILLEDGSELLLEDGSELLLEKASDNKPSEDQDVYILLEDGLQLLLENGSSILLENQ